MIVLFDLPATVQVLLSTSLLTEVSIEKDLWQGLAVRFSVSPVQKLQGDIKWVRFKNK